MEVKMEILKSNRESGSKKQGKSNLVEIQKVAGDKSIKFTSINVDNFSKLNSIQN